MAAEERQRGLPRLGPRYDGDYELHNVQVQRMLRGFIAQRPLERSVMPHGTPASTFEALAKEVFAQALTVNVVKPVVHLTLHPTRPQLPEA